MSYVDSPGFEVTFASFMRALSLSKAYSPGQIDKLFYFHDDILTLSHIPVVIDTYIWNILLCIFDFFMIYLSCPLGLFNNINIDLNNVSSSQYLYSKTWVLKSSIIGISITLVLLIYYWGSYIRYIPHIRILSEFKATILYATLVYLPLLFVPLCGLTFGSVLVANIEHEFSQFSLTSTSFALSLIFITFLVTISLFTVSTRYSLTMRNGQFAYWRPPFSLVDYFILFLSSMFFPFRMSYEPRAATIIAVIQFLYGINYLLNLRNFPFVSIVPLTIQIKISIDIMIFSIFTVINIWIESTQIITYSIFIVISYVSTCLSLFVLTILFKNSSGKIANLNYSNLPLSKASVSMIRFAINLSMTDVTRPEIIKAIALWRFSFDLVPDIVRYCIITHQSLKDYIIPHRSYTSICIAPLQFLAFQFDFYENYAAEDDNPRVEPRVEELKLLLNQAQVILDNFWTDPSFDQMDVYALGCEIRRITNKFITIASYFPHSKAISNLWDTYTNEIVYIDFPNQLKRNNPYELLYNPHTTVYGYLVHSEVKKPVLTEKKKSNVDWYLNQITTKSTAPLAIFYGIFFVFFICVTLIIDHHSYKLTESRLDHFTNTSDFLRLLTELANEKLSFTESYAVMPSYHEISDLLGIDEETANIFSLTRIQSRSELADLVSLYTFIDNIPLPTNIGKCKEIPLFLLLKYNLPENSDADLIYCRMLYINFYSQYIARISDDIIWNYSDEDKIGKLSVGVFISIFIGTSTVLFIIFLVYDERQQHKMIFTVKAISKIYKKGRNLKTKSYNIGLNILYSIIIWIIIMTLSCLLYALCEIPTQKENKKVIRLLSQVSIISKISTSAQDSLSYMEGHYINQLDIPNIVDYLTFSREELVRLIDQLLEIGFESIFQIIPPLDKWSINGSNSFSSILIDYSQLLSNQTKDTEFRFFYARYLYLFNISILISSTLPEMINKAQIEIQKISSIFIISSFVIVFLVVICMILNFFIYSRKITWYYAITTYLRRTILEECSSFHLIQKMISKQKVSNYLEELPFPFLITEIQSGIIIYSNSKIIEYIDYSTNQIIGQKLNSIFNIKNDICTVNIDNKSSILQFHFDQLDQNLQTISITDITDVYETNQTYKEMIKQMRPNIASFPVRDLMIFIKIRYDQKSTQSHIIKSNTQSNILLQSSQLATMDNNNNSNNNINMNLNNNNNNNNNNINITGINHINQSGSSNLNLIKNSKSTTFSNNSNNLNNNELDPEFLLNLFDEAENNFNGATRISCGATFYSALIPKSAIVNDHGQQFLAFLSLLTEQTENDFIAAVVFGMISCIPLDDDETRAVVCGETSNRANDCIISGNKNKIYMDDIIISSFIGDEVIDNSELLKNNLIVISPKTPPKI